MTGGKSYDHIHVHKCMCVCIYLHRHAFILLHAKQKNPSIFCCNLLIFVGIHQSRSQKNAFLAEIKRQV